MAKRAKTDIAEIVPELQCYILIDGDCVLCSRLYQFLYQRDRHARFRFDTLQSYPDSPLQGTVVYMEQGKLYTRSDAALRIAAKLGGPYRLLAAGRMLPRALRDRIYLSIAARRYRWFGRKEECTVPTPEAKQRWASEPEQEWIAQQLRRTIGEASE